MEEKSLYTAYQVTTCLVAELKKNGLRDAFSRDIASYSELFLSHTTEGRKFLKRLRFAASRRLVNLATEWVSPGFSQFLVLRKYFIEHKVRAFLSAHPDGQVVNIGAGMDTLLARLTKEGMTQTFIEIDYPSVAHAKQHFRTQNLEFAGFDLSEVSLEEVLGHTGFDRTKPVFFIMEGLLMYLPEQVAFDLLSRLTQLSDEKVGMVFSAILKSEQKDPLKGIRQTILKRNNAPLEWDMEKDRLKEKLAGAGIQVKEQIDHKSLFDCFGQGLKEPLKRFNDEFYNYAERMDLPDL